MASLLIHIKNIFRNMTINRQNKSRIIRRDISLVASNCNGACILHDLGLEFNSPFVNLWLKPSDFIKLCRNFNEYMQEELVFTKEDGIKYPVGVLKDIKIYFQHYKSESEAKAKWESRKKRINYNELYFLFTDRDGCSIEDKIAFMDLPYKNKVIFVHEDEPNNPYSVYIPGFESMESIGMTMDYRGRFKLNKYYDVFDYVEWFNTGRVCCSKE